MKKPNTNENVENVDTQVVDKFESLNGFVNALINKDDALADSNFKAYAVVKAREILNPVTEHAQMKDEEEDDEDEDDQSSKYSHLLKNRDKKKAPLKKMKKGKDELSEAAFLKEFTGDESPIRLKGDDVYVNNKLVGTVDSDLSDINSGIEFTSTDGSVTEHFDTIKELYRFLIETFKVSSEIPLDADEE